VEFSNELDTYEKLLDSLQHGDIVNKWCALFIHSFILIQAARPINNRQKQCIMHTMINCVLLSHKSTRFVLLSHKSTRFVLLSHKSTRFVLLSHKSTQFVLLSHKSTRFVLLSHKSTQLIIVCIIHECTLHPRVQHMTSPGPSQNLILGMHQTFDL